MGTIKELMSPLKDEGIDYIWYAKYNDDSFKYESDDSKNRTDFDSVYKDRDKIKQFGLLGEGRTINYQLDSGEICNNDATGFDYDKFLFSLTTDNGTVEITDNPDADYTDFTARKYIHTDISLGQDVHDVVPEVGPIAFGYTTTIECDGFKVKTEILYLVNGNCEEIKVSLTPEKDLKGDLTFILEHTAISGTIGIDIKKDQRSEFKIRL